MSQHYFHTTTESGQPVCVTLGWDRPLGHFFMEVEQLRTPTAEPSTPPAFDADEDDLGGGLLYSNLQERDAFTKSLDDYRAKLKELGIAVPDAMFVEVAWDEMLRVGNRYLWYCADGTFSEEQPCKAA
jgi:hypothetical protein